MKRATYANKYTAKRGFISIHALVKRATKENFNNMLISGISIHALVKRATDKTNYYYFVRIHFNPRPREEGDLFHAVLFSSKLISIHALVKRATSLQIVK